MPDIAMCTQECPKSFDCYRHERSGTIASDWRQCYQNFDALTCVSQIPTGNPELQMEVALIQFLANLQSLRFVRSGRNGSWKTAYAETGRLLAQQLRLIAKDASTPEVIQELEEIAAFYEAPVEDPEMGSYDQGKRAAITDFAVAVLTCVQGKIGHKETLDKLLSEFTQ